MMVKKDDILNLLDWNASREEQELGIRLGRKEKIDIFMQPCSEKHSKDVWGNCAVILLEKTDKELTPYLRSLLEWIQDLTWPGALSILERLRRFERSEAFNSAFDSCLAIAKSKKDEVWEQNLHMI